METQPKQAPSVGGCPSCGAPLAADAAACLVCGHSTMAEADMAEVGAAGTQMETSAPVPAPLPGPNEWRCDWCEAINPLGAERCAACGAVYPHPDQDAMLQRAAQARIETALEDIDMRERARPKPFWRRLFG